MNGTKPPVTIVSAASAPYGRSLLQLLRSVARHQPDARVVIYDLGLSQNQRASVLAELPGDVLRRFDFTRWPPHVGIRKRRINTNAWKPIILSELLSRDDTNDGLMLWLDSATVLCKPLTPILDWIQQTGFYTPYGAGSSIEAFTHRSTLAALDVPSHIRTARQRASGVVGLSLASEPAKRLVHAWAHYAALDQYIIPSGADHSNHRFDQSLYNILLHAYQEHYGLCLTTDEIDVSSTRPTPLYRTRNKVHERVPLSFDPLVRCYFWWRRVLDVAILKMRQPYAYQTNAQAEPGCDAATRVAATHNVAR